MNLTDNLELTYTSYAYNPNGVERQFAVQQNGRHQARTNVHRFVTNAFDDALRMLDEKLGVDTENVYYADQYANTFLYENGVQAQANRSSLKFTVNDGTTRDFAFVVNPDDSKFVLIRLPMVGGGIGPEYAFPVTAAGLAEMSKLIDALYED